MSLFKEKIILKIWYCLHLKVFHWPHTWQTNKQTGRETNKKPWCPILCWLHIIFKVFLRNKNCYVAPPSGNISLLQTFALLHSNIPFPSAETEDVTLTWQTLLLNWIKSIIKNITISQNNQILIIQISFMSFYRMSFFLCVKQMNQHDEYHRLHAMLKELCLKSHDCCWVCMILSTAHHT